LYKKLFILASLFALSSCEQDQSENEILETAEINFPYTWSHPECPFTINFPGEPKVEIKKNSLGKPVLIAELDFNQTTLEFYCDIDLINVVKDSQNYTNFQLAENFVQQFSNILETSKSEYYEIKSTNLYNVENAILEFSNINTLGENEVFSNGLILIKGKTLATATYYSNSKYNSTGIEFLKTIKTKPLND